MTTVSIFTPSGQRILRIGGLSYLDGAWLPVQGALAAQYDVPMDAVDTSEDDDGTEWVTVDGRTIGYMTTE